MSPERPPDPDWLAEVQGLIADPEQTGEVMYTLMARLIGVRDPRLRVPMVREVLTDVPGPLLIAMLVRISEEAAAGEGRCKEVLALLTVHREILGEMPAAFRGQLAALAIAVGQPRVAMLLEAPAVDGRKLDLATPENEVYPLPLGVRRQAARSRDRDLIDRILRDRHPQVIALVLDNALLTERDVVNLAARRPMTGEALRHIATHRRWSASYEVRKALAANPYTPPDLGFGLLGGLMLQDLRQIAQAAVLLPEVQAECERLLASRQTRTPASLPSADPAEIDALVADLIAAHDLEGLNPEEEQDLSEGELEELGRWVDVLEAEGLPDPVRVDAEQIADLLDDGA